MKKITLLAITSVAISFASCKKDYTCTCTTQGSTGSNVYKIIGVNKRTATANCVSTTKTSSSSGSAAEVTTCTLSK